MVSRCEIFQRASKLSIAAHPKGISYGESLRDFPASKQIVDRGAPEGYLLVPIKIIKPIQT